LNAKSKQRFFFLTFFILLTSCQQPLSVKQEYLTPELRASYHVRTPDPGLSCPTTGQKLSISWNVKKIAPCYSEMYIDSYIRFNNREQIHFIIPIKHPTGCFPYYLLNEEYCSTGGMQAYKFDLVADGTILDTWRHQLWVDLIEIESSSEDDTSTF